MHAASLLLQEAVHCTLFLGSTPFARLLVAETVARFVTSAIDETTVAKEVGALVELGVPESDIWQAKAERAR
jgi:hypothetical protein